MNGSGNSISAADIADMWDPPASKPLHGRRFMSKCLYGTEAATRHMEGLKQ